MPSDDRMTIEIAGLCAAAVALCAALLAVQRSRAAARARTQAEEAFLGLGSHERSPAAAIVRRYREAPSPLVRDSRGAWRTGRLDRVLAGDFDLMGGL